MPSAMDNNMEAFVIKRRSVDGRRESKREKDNISKIRVNVRKVAHAFCSPRKRDSLTRLRGRPEVGRFL